MERGLARDSIPVAGSIDKSRVLDIKPLRTLKSIFPSPPTSSSSSSQIPPFVCSTPSGPFPPGVTPFYPFVFPQEPQGLPDQSPRTPIAIPNQAGHYESKTPISAAVPINSFRNPTNDNDNMEKSKSGGGSKNRTDGSIMEGDAYSDSQILSAQYPNNSIMNTDKAKAKTKAKAKGSSKLGIKRGKYKKHRRDTVDIFSPDMDMDLPLDLSFDNIMSKYNLTAFDTPRAEVDKDFVDLILTVYNSLRREISKIEDVKDATPGIIRRPDLKAHSLMITKGIRANANKRFGFVPGVEVGDIFYFRIEMCLVGLHAPSMGGIDYMTVNINSEEESLAVSIVSSGGYDDDAEDGNVLLYSGQGGNLYIKNNDKGLEDQKLERGNLALEKSLHRGNQVRVIRGMRDHTYPTGKVYLYDGLYKIQESWVEKSKSGCNCFKYKLVRVAGQPEAFVLWKSIQQWKNGSSSSRVGVILPDLTSGTERLPVSLVNEIDDEKGPAYFTYIPSLKYPEPANSLNHPSLGCSCKGGCQPNALTCTCIKKNNGYLPYTGSGNIAENRDMIYECDSSCSCPLICKNRVCQTGLKVRLEVFKTRDKGWGLRSWDPIRAGGFICEYAGEVLDRSNNKMSESEDAYIFDASRIYMMPEFLRSDLGNNRKMQYPLIISAKNAGNVGRFMNHSCSPNVDWQAVLYGSNPESGIHIAFHATKNIPPMTELTYDYGIVESSNGGVGLRRKKCLCGSPKCRDFFD